MITIKNSQKTFPLKIAPLERAAKKMIAELGYAKFDLGIWFVGPKTMQRYNRDYRKKNKVTDILSFPYHPDLKAGDRISVVHPEDKNLGDLIICPLKLQQDIYLWDRTFDEHLIALLAHGIAHLLGYDHITDDDFEAMQKIELRLIKSAK